jgi:hypothetical protein
MEASKMADYKEKDANRDPLTGEPGSHPVGTGAGALGGAAAGAAAGTAAGGPVGTIVGGIVGAVAGAAAGHAMAEAVNPTVEDEYWRNNYMVRPYIIGGEPYDLYQPAYRYGWESYENYPGRKFDDVESDLERGWEKTEHATKLGWEKAKHATRDAWHRIERVLPGDFDGDGR